eukprot:TRINITY_DN1993_c1_g2_i1.p1 TRINITY_DN1993_c1_g2~~TRINITY_DN1993_c1_g2_i1.p1  ORF type:complete len:288 (-),score=57.64 TRINITY_DN1993_c1_g2_i1:470-1333(-)
MDGTCSEAAVTDMDDKEEPVFFTDFVDAVNPATPLLLCDASACRRCGVRSGGDDSAAGRPLRIGVLDSSFNPPTKAHDRLLRLADAAPGVGPFDVRILMLGKANADKAIVGASLPERLAMMRRMAGAGDSGKCSDGASGAPSALLAVTCHALFVDKARALLQSLGEDPASPQSTVYFIVGSDTIVRIFNPKYYKEPEKELGDLFGMAHLVSFDRDEATIAQTAEALQTPLAQLFRDRISLLKLDDASLQEVSSTRVRDAIRQGGGELSELLLPGVEAYVRQHPHLYS